jgi:EAL and modified HD-GYP domain-containing signal transduction protein
MQIRQGVGSIFKSKYCSGNWEHCARYQVSRELGEAFVPDNLYPNMTDVAKSIIAKHRKTDARKDDAQLYSFIARQPIFDRNMGIYGYELLYRKGNDNYFVQTDDDQATAELIYNSFLVFGLYDLTDGTKAFINFSKDLIDSDIPSLLPKQSIIIEVLERNQATQASVEACRRIKALDYSLALDDYVFSPDSLPLLEYADIVKIDFPATSIERQAALIRKYKNKVRFLAEKVETREDFNRALALGYDFFQGFFFCKPLMANSRDVASLNINLFNILKELNTIDPSFNKIASIIQGDLGLSLKILKLANSVYFGARSEVKSILHALSFIGLNELYQWISIMMLKEYGNLENAELIKLSFVRAKFLELLALELYPDRNANEFFFTGMFSFIDSLLNQNMETVLKGLPLPASVKKALMGEPSEQRRLLDCVTAYENADFDGDQIQSVMDQIGSKKFISLYIDSIKWVRSLNY